MDGKKVEMNEQQWRLFEYNMSRWMMENKYILDNEEKKKFYKCANISLGVGIFNGSLVYFLCKKYANYFTPFSRAFLTFSFGIYSSSIVNKIYRRKVYTEILTSRTTMSEKARETMKQILNKDTTSYNQTPNQHTDKKTTAIPFQKNENVNGNEREYVPTPTLTPLPPPSLSYEKENSYFMNEEEFLSAQQNLTVEEPKKLSTSEKRDDITSPNEQIQNLERQEMDFMNNSFNEGKYVSWEEIRRRNE